MSGHPAKQAIQQLLETRAVGAVPHGAQGFGMQQLPLQGFAFVRVTGPPLAIVPRTEGNPMTSSSLFTLGRAAARPREKG